MRLSHRELLVSSLSPVSQVSCQPVSNELAAEPAALPLPSAAAESTPVACKSVWFAVCLSVKSKRQPQLQLQCQLPCLWIRPVVPNGRSGRCAQREHGDWFWPGGHGVLVPSSVLAFVNSVHPRSDPSSGVSGQPGGTSRRLVHRAPCLRGMTHACLSTCCAQPHLCHGGEVVHGAITTL